MVHFGLSTFKEKKSSAGTTSNQSSYHNLQKMEFHFNFNKPTISKKVGDFLNSNLKSEKEKDCLNIILSGRKLQDGDANLLLNSVLKTHSHHYPPASEASRGVY